MWLMLSLAFGILPEELMLRMSSAQFVEYMALDRIAAWSAESRDFREDLRHGLRCAVLANAHRGRGRRPKPADFMLTHQRSEPMDPDEIEARLDDVLGPRKKA